MSNADSNESNVTNIRLTGEANDVVQQLSNESKQTKTQVVRYALATYAKLLREAQKGVTISLVDEKTKKVRDLILPM